MEYWNNGFRGICDIQKSSFPLLSPTFHYSTIPSFQSVMRKVINTKKLLYQQVVEFLRGYLNTNEGPIYQTGVEDRLCRHDGLGLVN
jgi:hypothetical protein